MGLDTQADRAGGHQNPHMSYQAVSKQLIDKPGSKKKKPLRPNYGSIQLSEKSNSSWQAYWPSVAFTAIGIGWACQISYTTPTLRTLGLSDSKVSYTWLAAPTTGMLVQPIAGVYSDFCSHPWGRRRPFIFWGAVTTACGLLLFSNAKAIGMWVHDTEGDHPVGLAVAIAAMFLIDCCLGVIAGPMRALLVDTASASRHLEGNAWYSVHGSLGACMGYVLGSLPLASWAWLSWMGTSLRVLYTFTAITVLVVCGITLFQVPEEQHHRAPGERPPTIGKVLRTVFRGVMEQPKPIARVFVVQLWTYFGWFAMVIYGSDWMGEVVYGGSPNVRDAKYPLYEQGVAAASFGYALLAGGGAVWSTLIPCASKRWGIRWVYGGSLLLMGAVLIGSLYVKQGQKTEALMLFVVMSVPYATMHSIPWTVVTATAGKQKVDRGLFTAVFNISQCATEFAVALVGGVVSSHFGTVAAVMAMGGGGSLLAAVLCYWIIEPDVVVHADGVGMEAAMVLHSDSPRTATFIKHMRAPQYWQTDSTDLDSASEYDASEQSLEGTPITSPTYRPRVMVDHLEDGGN